MSVYDIIEEWALEALYHEHEWYCPAVLMGVAE